MGLLQWNNVFKLGEDEVLRPPVVALKQYNMDEVHNKSWCSYRWPIAYTIFHILLGNDLPFPLTKKKGDLQTDPVGK